MLALPKLETKPEFYAWDDSVESDRRAYIERIYAALNRAGAQMEGDEQRERVVEEARLAFQHNVEVYSETPGLMRGALWGTINIVKGGIALSMRTATMSRKAM
jgi:heme oxygenase